VGAVKDNTAYFDKNTLGLGTTILWISVGVVVVIIGVQVLFLYAIIMCYMFIRDKQAYCLSVEDDPESMLFCFVLFDLFLQFQCSMTIVIMARFRRR
jgi:hypothetical protein